MIGALGFVVGAAWASLVWGAVLRRQRQQFDRERPSIDNNPRARQ